MEVYQNNKIIKNKKHYLHQAKNVAHFLNEGQIYLNVTNILHERNQKTSSIFAIMLRAMDIYSKLKVHIRDNDSDSEDWVIDEELSSEEEDSDDSDDSDDGNHRNEIPVGVGFEQEMIEFNEQFDKVCICCLTEIYYREFLLANIKSLITRIKSLCVAFTSSSSALYVMLHLMMKDYCERVRLFLRDNTRLTESRQGRSPRDDCHKYDLLEQLLERVSKEQEYVSKYADIKENGKVNN